MFFLWRFDFQLAFGSLKILPMQVYFDQSLSLNVDLFSIHVGVHFLASMMDEWMTKRENHS
jgi:hypothetical protein